MADSPPPGLDQFIANNNAVAPNSSDIPSGLDEFIKPELNEEKYGTTGQQLKTGLEGAASAATFGLSTGIEKSLGVKPEDIEGRRETNPIAHGAGQVAGLVGSSFLLPGGGAAGLLEKAGAGTAELAGLGAAETTAAKIGSTAVKSAVDNLLFQSGDEVSKMFSGHYDNSNDAVQTAIANVGLAGLIGGGLGAGIGSISPLWKATAGKKLNGLLGDMGNEVEHVAANGESIAAASLPEDLAQREMLSEAAGTLKPNANEVSSAYENLGITPPTATMSDSKFAQNMSSHLSKRPTYYGQKIGDEFANAYKGLRKASTETLRDATVKTEYEVGKEIKNGVSGAIEKELAPIEAKYKELEPHLKAMEVSDVVKNAAIEPLLALNDETATKLAEQINGVKNVFDITKERTKIGAKINDIYSGFRSSEDMPALKQARDALTKMREDAINESSKLTGIGKKEAGEISSSTIQDLRANDQAYRSLKQKLNKLGVEGGLGKVGSARQLADKFSKLSDENLAKRFFDLNDVNQLKFFKETFPKEFELARRYKLREILENSASERQGDNGVLAVDKYLRQLSDKNIGSEAREMLFSGNSEKIKNIRTAYQAMPGKFGTSDTATEFSFGKMLTPGGLLDNAYDGLKYAVLKRIPALMEATGTNDSKATGLAAMAFMKSGQPLEGEAFKSAVDFISQTIKGENLLSRASKSIFKSGSEVIPSKMLPDDRSREKLDKKLQNLQTNNEPLFDVGGKTAHYLPEHGTAIASTAVNAVNYLNSLRPMPQKQSPLDAEPEVTKAQKADYNKALDIAQQPLIVLDDIKRGTISPKDISTLHTLYPALYSRLSIKVYGDMIEHVNKNEAIPYATRMGVSMFLGEPLDSTLKPESIVAVQATFMRPSQQKDQQAKQVGPGAHSMKSLAKLPAQYATPSQAREAQKLKS